jgi:hypothetical protein
MIADVSALIRVKHFPNTKNRVIAMPVCVVSTFFHRNLSTCIGNVKGHAEVVPVFI